MAAICRLFARRMHWYRAVELRERAVLQVDGPDGKKLLNALATSDVLGLSPRTALYTMFLNVKVH